MQRDDFAKRSARGEPVSVLELLYPLLQGWDSVVIGADVEMGGSDQLFNLLLGRQFQREFEQRPQICATVPLLVGLDGEKKMSKSLGNYVGVDEPPAEQFGKLMKISDDLDEIEIGDCTRVAEVLVKAGFAQSRREAERLIAGNAVKIDGEPVRDQKQPWTAHGVAVLSVGSRRFVRVLPALSS